MSPEVKAEIPAEAIGEAAPQSHGRMIAVATVLTTLLAALTGFLQASALRTHDEADASAERLGALAVNAASANRDQAQVQIDRFQQLQGARGQEANADAFHQYANQPAAVSDMVRWHKVAVVIENDSKAIARDQHLLAICPATSDHQCLGPQTLTAICSPSAEPSRCGTAPGQPGWYSPEADPQYPNRYQVSAQRESYLLSARRDAANQKADAAENRFVHFTAALTLFAVAVFLFGYSLTPHGQKRRRLFTRVAAAFVVAGGVWALVHALEGSPTPPEAAAQAYADGEVALNDSDYQAAIRYLSKATKLRPEFVDAWADLGSARYEEGFAPAVTALSNSESTQVASVRALKDAIDAQRRAIDSGSESPTVRSDLGANLLYLGLLTHDRDMLDESRALSADAADRFEAQLRQGRHPGSYLLNSEFNAAEADLGNGSPNAAAEYRHAEQRMVQLDQEITIETVVASALTDLNLIAQTYPHLLARTQTLAENIVAISERTPYWDTTPGGYAQGGHDVARLSGVRIQPDPGHLQYTIAKATGFRRDYDLMSVQWEFKDPANGNWEVLPDVSGPVEPASTSGNLNDNGNGSFISENPSFLGQTTPHTCLPAGQYRAVLYVNGKLAGQSPATSSTWADSRATGFGGIGATFCSPGNWRGLDISSRIHAYTDGQGNGALIATIPTKALGGQLSAAAVSDALRGFVNGFTGAGGLSFPHLKPLGAEESSYFMNFSGARQQAWSYEPGGGKVGVLAAGAGVSKDNELYLGLVFGSATQSQAQSLLAHVNDTFLSYSQL